MRSFVDRPVPRELIVTAIRHGTLAPSAHNCQPWRFVVITELDKKIALAEAMGSKLRHDRLLDGDDVRSIEGDVDRRPRKSENGTSYGYPECCHGGTEYLAIPGIHESGGVLDVCAVICEGRSPF